MGPTSAGHRARAGRRHGFLIAAAVVLAVSPACGQRVRPDTSGGTDLRGILSRPLPGTRAREDDDSARALERALTGFDRIEAAQVVIGRESPDTSSSADPRHAAVRLTLTKPLRLTADWTEGIAAFITEALPGLPPQHITIVETTGRVLYAHGRAMPPKPPASPPPQDASAGPTGRSLVLLACVGLVGAALAAALVLVGWRRIKGREPPAPAGPFGFVTDLTDDELTDLLAGERPEVVAAVVGQLAPRQARRVRERAAQPHALQEPETPPGPEVVNALAEAMRRKLVSQ